MSTQQAEHRIGFPEEVAEETIEYAGCELTIGEAAADLRTAHEELEQYRKGALTLAAELQDVQTLAEMKGNDELARAARELKQSALAVINRVEPSRTE